MSACPACLPAPADAGALVEIRCLAGGGTLRLSFATAPPVELPATVLWRACRSAEGVMRQLSAADQPPQDVTIRSIAPVGDYAVNIVFSDGDRRGIYPFSYLRDLAFAGPAPVPAAA